MDFRPGGDAFGVFNVNLPVCGVAQGLLKLGRARKYADG